ncbi:Transcription elongation factor GreB [Rhodovastum atsumiense]|uniref:Transcription elongation factor GreB n=1 Tax=Rhodovastum atsumiense TaxID=504468 RepID=A0A5M6J0G6_9PROT|nr:transcription elongation factor GreB [Rhodovastum atsumiense]KAA5613699.1 transcription elongation factor GreB [Rhodovastum atsumiense]CAH2599620.1 Transcription elongation factor GreB [Rhodovastum atsumiense]
MTDEDDEEEGPRLPPGTKNYMTPAGNARLRAELQTLLRVERPKVVEIVSWAAGNGDRSENGDYLYGKKRLREIDRRVRWLTKRLDIAEVVDPACQPQRDRIFFGATVTYATEDDTERTVTILGADEADITRGEVSLYSPIARALLRARVGDVVKMHTPRGVEDVEVLAIRYPTPS